MDNAAQPRTEPLFLVALCLGAVWAFVGLSPFSFAQESNRYSSQDIAGQGLIRPASPATPNSIEVDDELVLLLVDRVAELEAKIELQDEHNHREDTDLISQWDDRFEFESVDKNFRLVLGGRVENDFAFFDTDPAIDNAFGPIEDGTQFRRARMVTSAKLYDGISFFSQYDFSTGRARFASVYLGFSDLPYLHNLRVGQFEEPLGLERLTSHRFTTFMERALTNAITPVRSTGVMLYDTALDRMATWSIGYFREANSVGFSQGAGGNALTGRLTRLLVYEGDGQRLLHVGASYSHRTFLENLARFRNRPESNLSTRFVDTGDIPVDKVDLFGAEIAGVRGPLSFQGEWIHNWTNTQSNELLKFSAFYFNLSWLLTGEHRTYSRSSATFRRIEPHKNFTWNDCGFTGSGAWELACRISRVDLTDGTVNGGVETNGTVGVNWYLNPHTRTMFNYILADRQGIGAARIFQGRLQINF